MSWRRMEVFVDIAAELSDRGYAFRFRAEGGSMHPTIRSGEALLVEPLSPADVRVGDIVAYRRQRRVIAHRVVHIDVGSQAMRVFTLRGDAVAAAADPSAGDLVERAEASQILGKVVAVESSKWDTRLLRSARQRADGLARRTNSCWGAMMSAMRGGIFRRGFDPRSVAILGVVAVGTMASIAGEPAIAQQLIIGDGTTFVQGCNGNLIVSGALTVQGSYINCSPTTSASSAGGGSGNLSVASLHVGSAGSFYFGGGNSDPTISFAGGGTVVNDGKLGIFGGGLSDGSGANPPDGTPFCPASGRVTLVSSTGTTAWSGGGSFYLYNLDVSNQPSSPLALTAYNSTITGSTGWTGGLCPSNVTAVQLEFFTATPTDGGNLISLKTGRDVNNLGFNIYREANGQRVKLNASLLAGTALIGGPGTVFTAGQAQQWIDDGGTPSAVYWLEEIDIKGARSWYGPAVANGGLKSAAVAKALGTTANLTATPNKPVALSSVGGGGKGPNAKTAPLTVKASSPAVTNASLTQQFALAASPAVQLGVKTEGWYVVTLAQLVAHGLDAGVDPNRLHLYANGIEQAIYIAGQSGGRRGAQFSVYFYGLGADTTWTDTQVYWLVAGKDNGRRIDTGGDRRGGATANNFPFTVEWEPRLLYLPAIRNGDDSNFFGPPVTDTLLTQPLTVTHLDVAGGASTLRVKLQGLTAGMHSVAVTLNNLLVGTVSFSDTTNRVATFTAQGVKEGQNTLGLMASSPGDISFVDSVQLSYPHRYLADDDSLRFPLAPGKTAAVGGFTTTPVTALDITDPANVSIVSGTVSGNAPNYSLRVVAPGNGNAPRTLLAFTGAQVQTPTITANRPSSWHTAQAGYDMVILTHASLMPSAAKLVALRQSQGLKVVVIDVQDLYDEFSFGLKTPYALKNFLYAASQNWKTKPHFVLLLGNGSEDPRSFLGGGVPDLVPAKLVDTTLSEVASDDWLVDFNDDGLPNVAIGRLPAESLAQADLMVNRTVAYDQVAPGAWQNRVLLVTGKTSSATDGFAGLTAAVKALLPNTVTTAVLDANTDPTAHSDLLAAINSGPALVNYIGHGSTQDWGANGLLFGTPDALGLTNGAQTPLVLTMTCLNGAYQDVYQTSLAKALLLAPAGGAIAVWGSSALTESPSQGEMNRAMIKALYGPKAMTIGEAAAAAKAGTPDMDVRRSWNLLGDPATVLY